MIQSTLQKVDPEHRTVLVQLVRYAFAGFAITLLVAGSYWAIAEYLHVDPMVSLTIVFIFFSVVSYFTHGAFSFRGHGERDRHHPGRDRRSRAGRGPTRGPGDVVGIHGRTRRPCGELRGDELSQREHPAPSRDGDARCVDGRTVPCVDR